SAYHLRRALPAPGGHYAGPMAAPDSSAPDTTGDNAPPFSVSELSAALKRTLEDRFGWVRLRGEASKVTRHSSGHVYLTLKADRACIGGGVWKGVVRTLQCQPEQGLEVIVTGKVTTYPARSSYQIVIETMEPAGVGALLAQLERLKARLADEGLFAPERKRSIPRVPRVIGVVTSPTGARGLRRRWRPPCAASPPCPPAGRFRARACCSSPAAAARSRTCGRSTTRRWCGPWRPARSR